MEMFTHRDVQSVVGVVLAPHHLSIGAILLVMTLKGWQNALQKANQLIFETLGMDS